MSTLESRIAALLSVLSEGENAVQCPLAIFAHGLRESYWAQVHHANGGTDVGSSNMNNNNNNNNNNHAPDLSDVLAERSLALLREEEAISSDEAALRVAYDKLRAEMARVEAQLQSFERRSRELAQQKAFCKLAMNLLVTGEVPEFYTPDAEFVVGAPREDSDPTPENAANTTVDGSEAVPEVAPMSSGSPKRTRRSTSMPKHQKQNNHQPQQPSQQNTGSGGNSRSQDLSASVEKDSNHVSEGSIGSRDRNTQYPLASENTPLSSRNSTRSSPTGSALLAMLRLPDVKETTLLHALESFDDHYFRRPLNWTKEQLQELQQVFIGLLKHLPQPRPPIQIAELRILGHIFRASTGINHATSDLTSPSNHPSPFSRLSDSAIMPMLHALLHEGHAVATLTRLLQSVNDDVKFEVLECLSPLIINSNSQHTHSNNGKNNMHNSNNNTNNNNNNKNSGGTVSDARKEFIAAGGLQPLVNIVASCTSEAVLERSLVLLWGLLARNDDEAKVRAEVRRLGGLRAVLDLLYTDSIPILENVAMTIGYITREETAKIDIREAGGLEKITATLRHPYESIQTKMAGAVWNCASNAENRAYLRHIGCIPALLELLSSPYEFVQENAAGALWNLSVDPENKTQILDYGGIAELAQLIAKSSSVSVVENASGTLWNCSAAVETRPAIRKAAAIPILLGVLNRKSIKEQQHSDLSTGKERSATLPISDKILDNVAGTLRNCAINDQNKPAIREAGGVELLLGKLKQGILQQPLSIPMPTLDKMSSTLWILTISPEIKHSVRLSGGIPLLAKILEASSSTAAKKSSSSNFVQLSMSVKEKIVGILRNCSTVQENRPAMVAAGVVRALVHVVEDCYITNDTKTSTKQLSSSSTSQPPPPPPPPPQQQQQPSLQLKETVASALWYLSRDDKVAPREEGGLELLCRLLQEEDQPSVVLEQAAGALSSLTVNSQENRIKLREYGGLHALLRLIQVKAPLAFPQNTPNGNGGKTTFSSSTTGRSAGVNSINSSSKMDGTVSHTYAVLNALLAIRNSSSSNEDNLRCVAEWRHPQTGEGVSSSSSTSASNSTSPFTASLLYIIQYGSEDCAREAALCVKNLCGHAKALDSLLQQDAVEVLGGLAERGSTDSVRRAAAMTLHSLARAQRR
ncbi:vacuolar protein 8 [Trypanosoma theileri]|uniref:Vacuolar protein 8 n=1 Tax=Trypanosoma theileri TaxID=67003 RepID=A0A1X0P6M1_9TRYP|nr:vacuolar protein 8 [Trypanosoma theileri]ORC92572.1 vacuolar protein 8 [Trypanosoma theileri]